jgi:hypothetical protein
MLISVAACVLLIALTTVVHFEVLRGLSAWLPRLRIQQRFKLLVVIFSTIGAHTVEILMYGMAFFAMVKIAVVGTLTGPAELSLMNCLYFSAETFTSLGFGDVTPVGPIRLLAGLEALNGLLLIGWSASYTYIAMERFWDKPDQG